MPPKKKQPANAFYFYMVERKAHYERNGEKFENGLKDVAEIAGPEWAVLPPSARKKYEDMAKEEKARAKGDTARKYTNQHRSFDMVERSRQDEEDARSKMVRDIESTITSLFTTNKIAEAKFYLIHVNYFCITEGECYHPAELAVAEFSLANGVEDVYHTIINPGPIPLGYRHDAMQKSDNVHHIPLEPKDGERDSRTIWNSVKKIVGRGRSAHGGAYPPMYTMPDNVNLNTSISCVKSVIKTLCDGCDDNPDDFLVYPLEKLFYELKNSCAEKSLQELGDDSDAQSEYWPSIPFACTRLEDDIYNYTANIACTYHFKEDQVVNCSRGFVQRWVFLICDECCHYLDIKLVPGRHVPLDADVNFKQRQQERQRESGSAAIKGESSRPFSFVDPSGRKLLAFKPVQIEHPPLPQPRVQAAVPRTPSVIDNSEENFPAIPVGRGRGRVTPRSGGDGPMSFAAAMKNCKK